VLIDPALPPGWDATNASVEVDGGRVYLTGLTALSGGKQFKRGDSNGDGGMNIADAVYILQNLFAQGPAIDCMDAADSNDDENVNIADAVYILQNLFAQGPPIPAPGPDTCGADPGGEPDIGCVSYTSCK
jgi:hypothetical protein